MKNIVSIIVPIYNAESYLEKCLNSIINQTYQNIEIIAVIDGCTDNSKEIVLSLAKKDNRIQIIDRENKGALYSRIEGLSHAQGEYIMFIDADDFIEKDCVEILLKHILKEKVDIVRCQYKILKNQKYKKEKLVVEKNTIYQKKEYDKIYELLYSSIYFNSMCRQLVKKDIIEKVKIKDFSINYGEDLLFQIELLNLSSSIMLIPDYLYIYNQNDNSITFTKDIEKIKTKMISSCKVNEVLYENIKKMNVKNKKKYYDLIAIKTLYNIFNQYINFVKTANNTVFIKEVYELEFIKEILNIFKINNLSKKLQNYNYLYQKGIIKLSKRKTISLNLYIKYIMLPTIKIHNKIKN